MYIEAAYHHHLSTDQTSEGGLTIGRERGGGDN